ncbi:EpsG family protein [Halobacillus amylolyticus]|uniref:EpsG family protein n=1 Tax=Halobacillus amylolyticus TaxID=2932259 RepID=A0ABY4HIR1_9BACI|nr:EpsG family protein [Halobacillus amylolyticus]UOR13800.1 EpsG family protein [Halobacillus amylolyticus]
MTILWMNLALVFGFALLAKLGAVSVQYNTVTWIRPNKLLITAALSSLVVVSGLRSNIGDTYFYKHTYEVNTFTWEFIQSQKDIGFGLLQMLLKYVSNDPQLLLITTAFITNSLVIVVLYNYSRMLELSIYVYITGGLFLVSMNGVRQALAAAIAFTAIKFLIEASFTKYMIVILFASLFHLSALILLPIYFLVQVKVWSKATIALIVFSILIVMGYEQFSALLFTAIEGTQYGGYEDFAEGGANLLRVAVDLVPLLIAYLGRNKLREIFPNSDVIINMCLIGCVFMVVATQNWIFARFNVYFGLYQLILVSWVVKLFRERDEKLVYYGIIVCYLVYFYYENVVNLNIIYKSNFL